MKSQLFLLASLFLCSSPLSGLWTKPSMAANLEFWKHHGKNILIKNNTSFDLSVTIAACYATIKRGPIALFLLIPSGDEVIAYIPFEKDMLKTTISVNPNDHEEEEEEEKEEEEAGVSVNLLSAVIKPEDTIFQVIHDSGKIAFADVL